MLVVDYRALHWPDSPVDALAEFTNKVVAEIRDCAKMRGIANTVAEKNADRMTEIDAVAIILPDLGFRHEEWQRSIVRELARECAPMRVNAVLAEDPDALGAVEDYLASAPGVTGQLLKTES